MESKQDDNKARLDSLGKLYSIQRSAYNTLLEKVKFAAQVLESVAGRAEQAWATEGEGEVPTETIVENLLNEVEDTVLPMLKSLSNPPKDLRLAQDQYHKLKEASRKGSRERRRK